MGRVSRASAVFLAWLPGVLSPFWPVASIDAASITIHDHSRGGPCNGAFELNLPSPDGSVFAAVCYPDEGGSRPARWTNEGGLELLAGFASSELGLGVAVTNDGRIVAGSAHRGGKPTAFRWQEGVGVVWLAPDSPEIRESFVTALAADGSVVVGIESHAPGVVRAFRWSEAEGHRLLLPGSGPDVQTLPLRVSEDGTTVLGLWNDASNDQVYRWTPGDGFRLVGTAFFRRAVNVWRGSRDLSTLVGYQRGAPGDSLDAIRWTEGGGIERLIDLGDSEPHVSSAHAVSDDGAVIVGTQGHLDGFRWTPSGGASLLPKAGHQSFVPLEISGDGSVVLGYGHLGENRIAALIWDETYGTRSLAAELEKHFGLDLGGRTLSTARFVTRDGDVIVGAGMDARGNEFTYLARLDGCRDTQEVAVIAGAPPGAIAMPHAVQLDGSGSSREPGAAGGIVSYRWEVVTGPAVLVGPMDAPVVDVQGVSAGAARVRLTVDDGACSNPASSETVLHFCDSAAAGNAEILGLCDFPVTEDGADPPARLSADGRAVVGSISLPGLSRKAVRWTAAAGLELLGDVPGGNAYTMNMATDCSADGSVVVGLGSDGSRFVPFLWTTQTRVMALEGVVPDPSFDLSRVVITEDGAIVHWLEPDSAQRFSTFLRRWQGGATHYVPGTGFERYALQAGSGDGSSLALSQGLLAYRKHGTASELALPLGDLPGGAQASKAAAISRDGSVIVGRSESVHGIEAFRWVEGRGMRGLGDLPGRAFSSEALALSADGRIVVGRATSELGSEAFLWDAEQGMRPLKQVLEAAHGLDLAGWRLESAQGISADGLTILGRGVNPSGERSLWLVRRDLCGDPPEHARIAGAPSAPTSIAVPVALDGSGSSTAEGEGRGITSYRWEVVSGPGAVSGRSDESGVTIHGEAAGEVVVRLTVDDDGCGQRFASTEATIRFREPDPGNWLPCDANADARVDMSDSVYILGHLFLGAPGPACPPSLDCNRDGLRDLSDAIYGLTFLFLGGPPPESPYPQCGTFAGCRDNCP